jgi:hypothetical protein
VDLCPGSHPWTEGCGCVIAVIVLLMAGVALAVVR